MMTFRMLSAAVVLGASALALATTPASAAACRDAHGKFAKCPATAAAPAAKPAAVPAAKPAPAPLAIAAAAPATKGARCHAANGKFVKCGTVTATMTKAAATPAHKPA